MLEYSIVVVDDDSFSREHAKVLLEQEGMHVTCLSCGEELLKYVENVTPDLILLDIMMPDVDGFEVYILLRRFEENMGRMNIPVIFVSGDQDSESEEMGLVLGASDYIRKPLIKDVLIRRIHNSIKKSKEIEILKEEATLDKLTGLLNKAKGTDRISKLCLRKSGALMILDLDNFKLVNDLFGHETGNQVLKAFADIAVKNSRETDTICRIGGDEFMGFYEDMIDDRAVGSLTMRLNAQLSEEARKIMGEDNGIPLGISVGVVMVPEFGRDYETLFAMADKALYRVKQNGKHGYAIHGADDDRPETEDEVSEHKLDRLVQIIEERNDKAGAFFLGKDYFSIVYKFMMRFYRRYGGDAAIILFELDLSQENMANAMEVADQFGHAIEKKLRISDVIMQNGVQNFFVLLTECGKDNIEKAITRMIDAFKETKAGQYVEVNYIYKCLPETEE